MNVTIAIISVLVVLVLVIFLLPRREQYIPREYVGLASIPSFISSTSRRKDGYPDMSTVDKITASLHEGFSPDQNYLPPFQVKNSTYWPSYYYSFPYENDTYAWPPGMFSRMYNWYPGFSTGSGLTFYKRPTGKDGPKPRNAWLNKTESGENQYNFISNRGEFYFDESDYQNLHYP